MDALLTPPAVAGSLRCDDDARGALCRRLVANLAAAGWSVCEGFLPPEMVATLAGEGRELWRQGTFRHARVGIGATLRLRPEVRGDHVLWLDEAEATASQGFYLREMERLRLALNRELFLGLFRYEGHLAFYPPGTGYGRHLDQFRGASHRVVSCILYLNEGWEEGDGGCLRLYLEAGDEAGEGAHRDIAPAGGTLVTFFSERFYHEVLPARRERLSLTGWLRRRD